MFLCDRIVQFPICATAVFGLKKFGLVRASGLRLLDGLGRIGASEARRSIVPCKRASGKRSGDMTRVGESVGVSGWARGRQRVMPLLSHVRRQREGGCG